MIIKQMYIYYIYVYHIYVYVIHNIGVLNGLRVTIFSY